MAGRAAALGGRRKLKFAMEIDGTFVEIRCPRCGYVLEVQLADVREQRRVFCPACKIAVQLVDRDASMSTALDEIEDAVNDVMRKLGGSK